MVEKCWIFISCNFIQILNKLKLKYTLRCIRNYKQCIEQSKIGQICSFLYRVFSKYLWIFLSNFLLNNNLNNNLKYFIYMGRILKRGIEGAASPYIQIYILIWNFKLVVPTPLFVSYSLIWDTEWIIYW